MENNKIAAIILSAGYSSRMGSFKPFLKFGEYTAIENVINTFKCALIEKIIVVVGHRGNEVIEKVKNTGVKCVVNEDYDKGMFSSVTKGVESLDAEVEGFFIHPVDIPLTKKSTIVKLKDSIFKINKGIIYPTFFGEKGHPTFIAAKYKKIILNSDGDGGLKRILESFSDDSGYVPVFDEAILKDMDIKDDYEKLLDYFNLNTLNKKECNALLNIYNVSPNIINHTTKVAQTAMDILKSIAGTDCCINGAVLEAAALLHDIAKGEKKHELKGAEILQELGYKNIGDIIATHTNLEVDENEKLSENEILYLADKLVKEVTNSYK